MTVLSPRLRKIVLTAHVTSSVGWLGAVVAYLTIDLVASFDQNPQIVRAAFLAMELIIWNAIVPLAFASVFTGVVNALGTHWGLFWHYWVLVKILLAIVATAVLMREAQVVSELSALASSNADPSQLPGIRALDRRPCRASRDDSFGHVQTSGDDALWLEEKVWPGNSPPHG